MKGLRGRGKGWREEIEGRRGRKGEEARSRELGRGF